MDAICYRIILDPFSVALLMTLQGSREHKDQASQLIR